MYEWDKRREGTVVLGLVKIKVRLPFCLQNGYARTETPTSFFASAFLFSGCNVLKSAPRRLVTKETETSGK